MRVLFGIYRWFCSLPAWLQGLIWGALFLSLLTSGWTWWQQGAAHETGSGEHRNGKTASPYDSGYEMTKFGLAHNSITLQIPGTGAESKQEVLLKDCQMIVQRIMASGQVPAGFYSAPDQWYRGCTDALDEWFAKRYP